MGVRMARGPTTRRTARIIHIMSATLMSTPALPLARSLNAVQWAGHGHRGHYEVWYVTIHDPVTRRAFWLRHTLHAPTDGRPGQAALWAFSFDPAGQGTQAIDRYAMESFVDHHDDGFALGPARFSPTTARGEVGEGADRIAWDLTLEAGPFGSFRHIPLKLFRVRLAGSAVSTPSLSLAVTGWIEVGGVRTRLDRACGEQGHVFGRRHADRWAWAHVHRFDDAPDAVLEGASAQVRKLGVMIPAATPFCLQVGDRRVAWQRARELWAPRSRFELGRWQVDARKDDLKVRAVISAPPEAFISVEYEDPSGDRLFCNHTEIADADVEVHRRVGGSWKLEQRLEARGSTAFEIGERGPRDPRPRRTMDLARTRAR
jgi:hypothetical protein